MAHYVARELGIRPNDILDHWGVAELLVAYGQYSNEDTYKNFMEWKALSAKAKNEVKKPKEYHVAFYSPADLEEGGETHGD